VDKLSSCAFSEGADAKRNSKNINFFMTIYSC
jgi:hypothetical protein